MRVRLAAMALLLAGGGVMQGCNTTPVGQGPIEFGPKMQASYDEYLRRVGPGAFVIGKRGGYYSYCTETGCVPGAVSQAMQLCRRHGDTDCRLYAVGGQVVWRRDLPAPDEADPVAVDTTVSADLQAERQRNAAKVDCARQLKGTLSAELQGAAGGGIGGEGITRAVDVRRPHGRWGGEREGHGGVHGRAAPGPGGCGDAQPAGRAGAAGHRHAETDCQLRPKPPSRD